MNVVELARELVSIPSVNPNSLATPGGAGTGELAMADRVESVLKELGAAQIDRWEICPGRPSVLAYLDFGASETLIFDAHLDTVPVEGMTVDPYGGRIDDGKLYGRGACDVKGPMAAMLCACANVRQAGEPARYNVLFAAVADEESGFGGVSSFVQRLDKSAYSAPVTGAVIAEPTLLNPVIAHKGTARWIIRTAGVAAHSSTPHLGENAIYKMAPVIQALEEYAMQLSESERHEKLGAPSLSVGLIRGGSAVNIVPDFCELQVDRRLIPGETLETASAALRDVLQNFILSVSNPIVAAPPMATAEDHPLVSQALNAGKHAGALPELEYANYCTDASFYPQIEVPCIVWGPGSIAQAHTKDEWIDLRQLELGVAAYQKLITG